MHLKDILQENRYKLVKVIFRHGWRKLQTVVVENGKGEMFFLKVCFDSASAYDESTGNIQLIDFGKVKEQGTWIEDILFLSTTLHGFFHRKENDEHWKTILHAIKENYSMNNRQYLIFLDLMRICLLAANTNSRLLPGVNKGELCLRYFLLPIRLLFLKQSAK